MTNNQEVIRASINSAFTDKNGKPRNPPPEDLERGRVRHGIENFHEEQRLKKEEGEIWDD
jgi:hypothetical protein